MKILLNVYLWTRKIPLHFGRHPLLNHEDAKTENLQLRPQIIVTARKNYFWYFVIWCT